MLFIIGMGIEKGDMTVKGIEAIKESKEIFVENYTSFPYELEFETTLLPRGKVESNFLLDKAKENTIALLIPGDPLFATTHISLIKEGNEKGIEVEAIHAPSIINAIARTGLSTYKFGRIVTLSRTYESDKERIENNLKAGLHSLCLIDPEMKLDDAIQILRTMGFDEKLLVCERLGSKTEKIHFGKEFTFEFGKPPYSIILPGELHFFEEEFIQQFHV